MAFANRSLFISKCYDAIRALRDVDQRALWDSSGFVGMDDTGYAAISSVLDGALALNAMNVTLANGTARGPYANIAILGDSISEGYNTPNHSTFGYAPLARGTYQRAQASTARPEGIIPAFRTDRFTLAGTWISSTGAYGPYGVAQQSNSASATATYAFYGTDVDVYYVTDTGTAAFSIQIDSDAAVSGVGGTTGSAVYGVKNVAAGTGRGFHTVTVTAPASGGYCVFWGIGGNDGAGSVKVHNLGRAGMSANGVATAGNVATMASLAPDLTIFALTTNDFAGQTALATYQAQLVTAITQAKLTGDVAFIIENNRNLSLSILQTQYNAVINTLAATYGAKFVVDIYTRWGSTNAAGVALGFIDTDGTHPTVAGHTDMALALSTALAAAEVYDFVDTFTRADSTTSIGTPDKGGPYTVISGVAGIQSNKGYLPSGAFNQVAYQGLRPMQYIGADLTANPVETLAPIFYLRYADANNYVQIDFSNGRVVLTTNIAGTFSGVTLATAAQTGLSATGAVAFSFSVFWGGDTLYAYINGVRVGSVFTFGAPALAAFGNKGLGTRFLLQSGTIDNLKSWY